MTGQGRSRSSLYVKKSSPAAENILDIPAAPDILPRVTASQALDAFLTPPRMRELSRESDFLARAVSRRVRLGPNGYARGGGEEIEIYSWGEGPTALFVHGWGGRAAHFEGCITRLVEAGWRAVAFDAPSHGRSTGTLSSAPAFAAAIQAVAEREGPFRVIAAHSLGALAASMALRRGMTAERVALLAACCWVVPLVVQFARQTGLDERTSQELLARATGEFRPEEASAEANAPFPAATSALLLHDPADNEMPYAHSEAIAASWPKATLAPAPGVGHRRILRSREIVGRVCDALIG